MSRDRKVSELLQMAAREAGVLQDALAECIQLLKLAATGQSISGEADMVLKQFARRDLIDAHIYSASDRLITVLNSTEPPPGMTPVHWDNMQVVRRHFTGVMRDNPLYAETAMKSEQHRNWYIGQLIKSFGATFGKEQLASLVFKVFAAAAR